MKRASAKDFFKTEAELCAAYQESAASEGWIIYPETAGFDLLLVRADTGHQLGIEAKLSLNAKVCEQIIPSQWTNADVGPDWRAVLVPEIGGAHGLRQMLEILGVMVFCPREGAGRYDGTTGQYTRRWDFPVAGNRYDAAWHDWNPKKRCELPEIIPRVAAGVPAPIQLTPWKIGALKVLAILKVDGCVTRDEVRACGVDPRRFCAADGWLAPAGDGKWTRGRMPAFDEQHPEAFTELLTKARAKRQAATT